MSVTELDSLREKLKNLRILHRQLDQQIIDLHPIPAINSLELIRMKKRKLVLKETIVRLESKLIPDLNA